MAVNLVDCDRQSFTSFHPEMPASGTTLKLLCLFWPDNNPAQHIVQVKIDDNCFVTTLKDMIKAERANAFAHIDACDLVLWRCSIPCVDNFKDTLTTISFDVLDNRFHRLPTTDAIFKHFGTDLLFETTPTIHILVEVPMFGEYSTRISYSATEIRVLLVGYPPLARLQNPSYLYQERRRFNTTFPGKAPSSLGVPSAFTKLQEKENQKIVWSRPFGADATVPVTLMHPVFRQFLDGCRDHQPTKQDNELVLELTASMSGFFVDEQARASKLREILSEYGIPVVTSTITFKGHEFRTDGAVEIFSNLVAIVKVKDEIGSKGAEPYAQVVLYYTHSTLQKAQFFPTFNFPAFLITVFGQTLLSLL